MKESTVATKLVGYERILWEGNIKSSSGKAAMKYPTLKELSLRRVIFMSDTGFFLLHFSFMCIALQLSQPFVGRLFERLCMLCFFLFCRFSYLLPLPELHLMSLLCTLH